MLITEVYNRIAKENNIPISSHFKEIAKAKRFCKRASRFFYGIYFVILLSFIFTSIMLAYAMAMSKESIFFPVLTIILFSIVGIIYEIHPIWTVKLLTFSIPDNKLSRDLRIKMDKLIRRRQLLQEIKKQASVPILVSVIGMLVVFAFFSIVCIITSNPIKLIDYNSNNLFIFRIIVQIALAIFCIPFCFCSLMALLWQLPFLFGSIWKIFTVNWFD